MPVKETFRRQRLNKKSDINEKEEVWRAAPVLLKAADFKVADEWKMARDALPTLFPAQESLSH